MSSQGTVNKQREGTVPHGDGDGRSTVTKSGQHLLPLPMFLGRGYRIQEGHYLLAISPQPIPPPSIFLMSWASIPCYMVSSLKAEETLFIFVPPLA